MKLFVIVFLLLSYSIYSDVKLDDTSILFFSPNNDGIKDEAIIKLNKDRYSVDEYCCKIYKGDKLVEVIEGQKNKNTLIYAWNGLKKNRKPYKDGDYIAFFNSKEKEDLSKKIKITIDTKRPTAEINCKFTSISPNYDGKHDQLVISQSGSVEKLWKGFITDQNGKKVKSFKWINSSPKNFSWDGKSDFGRIVEDGKYKYELESIDEAGNKSKIAALRDIIVDSSAPKVKLIIDNHYISPNGDSIKDFASVKVHTENSSKIESKECILINEITGEKVQINIADKSNFIIDGFTPNGDKLINGFYILQFTAKYINGYISLDSLRLHINRSIYSNLKVNPSPFYLIYENIASGKIDINLGLDQNIILDSCNLNLFTIQGVTVSSKNVKKIKSSNINFNIERVLNEEYILEVIIADKNGNKIIKESSFKPLIEFNKKGSDICLNNSKIFFDAYKYETDIGKERLTYIVSVLNKYSNSNFIIESNALDDGTSYKRLKEIAIKRGEFVQNKLLQNGLLNRNIELKIINPSKFSQRVVKIIYKNEVLEKENLY